MLRVLSSRALLKALAFDYKSQKQKREKGQKNTVKEAMAGKSPKPMRNTNVHSQSA